MPRLLTDPAELQSVLNRLLDRRRNEAFTVQQVEALAECAFRIALHPSTAVSRAAELLGLAKRADRANPKYPYHMARLYFRCGDFDQAGVWLERSRQLCPTSHRIWAHIGLLQREINDRHNDLNKGKSGYIPDAHKKRWKEIADLIRKGVDQFDPKLADYRSDFPETKAANQPLDLKQENQDVNGSPGEHVTRHSNAGICRWSRIQDLIAEDLLEGEAGVRMRDALREFLEVAASAADSRRGGRALFTALAIEWCVRGYSPEFVRRISPNGLVAPSPAAQVLDTFMTLTETPVEKLPSAVSAALSENEIPPLLAAALHRIYVLGSPPKVMRLVSDLREVRALLAYDKGVKEAPQDETTAFWLRVLEQDAKALDRQAFSPIDDFPPDDNSTGTLTPEAAITASRDHCKEVEAELQRARKWLDDRRVKPLEGIPDEDLIEANRIRLFVNGFKDLVAKATAQLASLRDSGQAASSGLAKEIEELEQMWQNLQVRPHILLLKRYPQKQFQPDATPTHIEGITAASPDSGTAPVTPSIVSSVEPQSQPKSQLSDQRALSDTTTSKTPTPREQLSDVAASLTERLRARFDSGIHSFAYYSPQQAAMAPLQALRMSVTARKAETLFRLGDRSAARKEWSLLLSEDAFDLRVLRNIAVCDTVEGDVQRYLSSWKKYMEMMYFQALASDDLTHLAGEREDFHRNFGNAYGLRMLFEDKPEDKSEPDRTDIEGFISSSNRVRLYMDHQLLAVFNHRLSYRTAPFILGVSRSAGPEDRDRARDKMVTWCRKVSAVIPSKLCDRVVASTVKRLDCACDRMKSARQMRDLRDDKAYLNESNSYLKFIAEIFSWKIRLHEMITRFPDFSLHPEYFEAIVSIYGADEIPIDTGQDLLEAVARNLKYDPEVISTLVGRASSQPLFQLLRFVFPPDGSPNDGRHAQRADTYQKLTGELAGHGLLTDQIRRVIDDPGNVPDLGLYPERIRNALQKQEPAATEDLAFMRSLNLRYPASAGIAYHHALLLLSSGNFEECKKALRAGVSGGFHESGREQCQDLLKQLQEHGH